MNKIWTLIETAAGICGGFLGWFFGGFDGLFRTLLVFAAIDYITGVLSAIERKELSSEIGFTGIVKKFVMFLIVGIANMIDTYLFNFSIGGGDILRDGVICFFLANEGVSILENSALLGLPIPDKLKDVLLQLRNKKNNKNENDKGDKNV